MQHLVIQLRCGNIIGQLQKRVNQHWQLKKLICDCLASPVISVLVSGKAFGSENANMNISSGWQTNEYQPNLLKTVNSRDFMLSVGNSLHNYYLFPVSRVINFRSL